jgi:diguanylate cyclase (GGDEF)-like protein/PAS domain S-box-containing protein
VVLRVGTALRLGGEDQVPRTGTATLQWLVGLFCAGIGTLMLVAPHQFAAAAYSALKPHLPLWGAFFLVGGSSLIGVAALRPRRLVVVAAHVWAGLALVSLSGGFIASSHLPGISNYAILGLGTIIVSLVPHRWRQRLLLGQDSFAAVIGIALTINGCYMLLMPEQFAAPIFDLVRPYLLLFGPGLVLGGLALLTIQSRPSFPRAVRWAAYLLPATVMLVYFTRGPLPYGSWTGTAYYGGFGISLALLPWLGPRLRRIDSGSLRLQFALALSVASALPLIGIVTFIANLTEVPPAAREIIAWVLLLIVGVAAAGGVVVARRLAGPLDVLTRAVEKLTAGDAAAPLPDSRITEVAHLSTSFGQMRDSLEARTAELELALAREQILRQAGAALVAAVDRQSIYQAAVESALALAGHPEDARATLAIGPTDVMTIVAVAGDQSTTVLGSRVDTSQLPAALRPAAKQQHVRSLDVDVETVGQVMGYAPKLGEMVNTPLLMRGELRGALIVASDHRLAEDCTEGLATLASEVVLALESAALAEDLHRRRSEARFRSLVRGSSDVIMIVDEAGIIQFASPSTERLLGYTVDDLFETHLAVLAHPHDAGRLLPLLTVAGEPPEQTRRAEWRVRHRNGAWLSFETIGTNLLDDPDVCGIVLNSRDVSERRVLEDQLKHQAFHDPLTKLPNRALFTDRLEHALARRGRRGTSVAVLFLDLDNFKVVNDSLGHQAGDRLLVVLAERLQVGLRPEDTVARVGGDEMAILLEDVETIGEVAEIASRIQQRLGAPVRLEGREVFTTVSIGVALSTIDHDRPEHLLRDADVALYRAKAQGKARHAIFDPSMDAQAMERLELETDLRYAVERDELRVYYQPIVDLESGRICEVEALIRWQHPLRGMIPPLQFIPLAEETGLIIPIGRWILCEAARQTRIWQQEHPTLPPLTLSVNISARQLQHPTLIAEIDGVLRETGLDPTTLRLEITESVVMEDAESTSVTLRALKGLGIELAIDDFGTGYSSLSYLNRFSVDAVKIDRSFVSEMGTSSRDATIIRAIIALAKSLQLSVTAEGIETNEQLRQLQDLGCNRGQGYLLAKPLPPEAIPGLLPTRYGGASVVDLLPQIALPTL